MRVPVVFDDVMSLLRHLEEAHEPHVHLYRGQARRYFHDWNDGTGFWRLDALYPSDYRFITQFAEASPTFPQRVTMARAFGRDVRDLFFEAMIRLVESGDAALAWLVP